MITRTCDETEDLKSRILDLKGPILILGASGFIGANLLRTIAKHRFDVAGVASRLPAWRLHGLPVAMVLQGNILIDVDLDRMLQETQPKTIFDCVAYGSYPFETDCQRIYDTNFIFLTRLLPRLVKRRIVAYIHAGSSSEYGTNAAGPSEDAFTAPNSDYAVSKVAAANLIYLYGKQLGLRCANLRLYSVYGPLEDSSRLIPQVISNGIARRFPEFVNPLVARDFLYIADAIASFVHAALYIDEEHWGESFNIGTGQESTMRMVADAARDLFSIEHEPSYSMKERSWDLRHWFARCERARKVLNWSARIDFRSGIKLTQKWYLSIDDRESFFRSSKFPFQSPQGSTTDKNTPTDILQ